MNAVVMSAVKSWVTKWLNSQVVPVGRHNIDETITLRVRGEVLKGEEETYTPTAHVPLLATLEFLVPHLGATRDVALEKMRVAMEQALLADVKGSETMPKAKDVEKAKKMVEEKYIDLLPPAQRDGKTIVKCTVEEVQGRTAAQISADVAKNTIAETVA
jgi:hypothetical protein